MRAIILPSASLGLFLSLSVGCHAQNVGETFAAFDPNSGEPIQIESDRLEVNDVDKIATYSGNVQMRQGETLMTAPELVVHYTGDPAPATADGATTAADATKGTTGNTTAAADSSESGSSGSAGSRVSRLEAGPGVTLHTATQLLTGDHIVFDMLNNLVTLEGKVVLTEGDSIVRGEKLTVNLTTKIGHVEGGRVQTLMAPSSGNTASQ